MKLAAGADHGGVELKDELVKRLEAIGHSVRDVGTHGSESVDYPDFGRRVADLVQAGEVDLGLLVCGTGQGMAMTANKRPGVRAAVVSDTFSARMTRAHNDCNVLCLGARVIGPGLAWDCVQAWLDASFEGGRHARRVGAIEPAGPQG